jgi:hypothetical protein
MFHAHVPIGLGLILALGAGSAVWTAKLESKDGSKISGTARVETVPAMTPPKDSLTPPPETQVASDEDLRVTVNLTSAPANASLGWGLYSGKCSDTNAGAPATVIGSPTAYSSIKVDAQGMGTATSTVKGAKVVAGSNYYVGVLQAQGGKLAACGHLEAAKTSTD